MYRILEVVGRMDRAGQETFLMNVLRTHDPKKYQIDFCVNTNHVGDYENEIKKLGGQIYHLTQRLTFSNLKSYLKEFRMVLKNNGPFDCVHCHTWLFGGFIMKAAAKERVPVRIMHSHNTQDVHKKTIFRFVFEKYTKHLINKYSTNKVACGKDAYKALFEVDCPSDNVILNNSVDVNKYNESTLDIGHLKLQKGLKAGFPIIINVARFNSVKNHVFTISVFEELLKRKEAILLLVGDGELIENMKSLVKKKKIDNNVLFMGNRNDVNELLMCSDVFIMPSLFEGLPVSLVEAQAAGLKCLISDTITNEADLGLNLITYLNLKSDSISKWADELLILCESNERPSFAFRKNALDNKGYLIESTWRKLNDIYTK